MVDYLSVEVGFDEFEGGRVRRKGGGGLKEGGCIGKGGL